MSTILEALKKSEEERKVTKVPTLADMPAPHEPQRWPNALLFIILCLLLVLVGFAVKFVLFPSANQPIVKSVAVPENVAAPVGVDRPSGSKATAEVNVEAEPVAVVNSDVIEVNVVSYSDQPEKRFVMIGGKLFRENEFVRAGLKVEEIRRDEVVLNQRGEQIIRRP